MGYTRFRGELVIYSCMVKVSYSFYASTLGTLGSEGLFLCGWAEGSDLDLQNGRIWAMLSRQADDKIASAEAQGMQARGNVVTQRLARGY